MSPDPCFLTALTPDEIDHFNRLFFSQEEIPLTETIKAHIFSAITEDHSEELLKINSFLTLKQIPHHTFSKLANSPYQGYTAFQWAVEKQAYSILALFGKNNNFQGGRVRFVNDKNQNIPTPLIRIIELDDLRAFNLVQERILKPNHDMFQYLETLCTEDRTHNEDFLRTLIDTESHREINRLENPAQLPKKARAILLTLYQKFLNQNLPEKIHHLLGKHLFKERLTLALKNPSTQRKRSITPEPASVTRAETPLGSSSRSASTPSRQLTLNSFFQKPSDEPATKRAHLESSPRKK